MKERLSEVSLKPRRGSSSSRAVAAFALPSNVDSAGCPANPLPLRSEANHVYRRCARMLMAASNRCGRLRSNAIAAQLLIEPHPCADGSRNTWKTGCCIDHPEIFE
jgi:hypothetical protein